MAQHDMNIANQGFPATRADLNNALQALVSNSSGTSAPSTTFANQWWYDTTNNKMYIRNEANNAWIEVFTLDQTSNEWQLTTGVIQAKDSDGLALKTDDGTTRLFIKDSDGAIGLGTASPDSELHISSGEPQLTITNTTHEDTDGGRESTIVFKGEQSGGEVSTLAEIEASHDGASDDEKGDLIFRTNDGSDGASPTERMRIDSDGQVGIGTSSPDSSGLHIRKDTSATTNNLLQLSNGAGSTTDGVKLVMEVANTSGNGAEIGTVRDGGSFNPYMYFSTSAGVGSAPTERMRIDSSGNVGIGTNNPSAKLQVVDNSALESRLVHEGNGTTVIRRDGTKSFILSESGNSAYRELVFGSQASVGGTITENMRISSSGNFLMPGIYSNTTSASANVVCQYSSGDVQRSTSSRRYKNSIQDSTVGLAELNTLRPVSFKGNNDGDIVFNGLIAEEVHDAGLTQFVEYDEEDRPDAIRYPHMVSLCIKAIQELSAKVTTLETQNTTQATQIADLITRVEALEGA